ncbi:MAG: PilZ domain-containing protein [Mariprofundales bacterium]|nr:PilZ domain-containing protein [Mariprofundales bacterium]
MAKSSGRAFTRVTIPVQAVITQNGSELHGTVTDISMNGASIRCDWQPLQQDCECGVTFTLGEEETINIIASGRVVRGHDDVIAIAFESVNIESIPYLRNLILYNAEETDQVQSEFVDHMGIR